MAYGVSVGGVRGVCILEGGMVFFSTKHTAPPPPGIPLSKKSHLIFDLPNHRAHLPSAAPSPPMSLPNAHPQTPQAGPPKI